MHYLKKILILCICFLGLPHIAIASPSTLTSSTQCMADLVRQSDIPIKEKLAQFFLETNTKFYLPSTIIKYGYTEKINNSKHERVKKIGDGDEDTDLVIEYITNWDNKYIVADRPCIRLRVHNIDAIYHPDAWIVRNEVTTHAIKNIILPFAVKLIDYLGDQAPDDLELTFCFDKNGDKFPQIEFEATTAQIRDYASGKITAKKLVEKYSFYHTLERQRHYLIKKIDD